MGASESKLAFKEDIFRLAGEPDIPADSQWWTRVSPLACPSPKLALLDQSIHHVRTKSVPLPSYQISSGSDGDSEDLTKN